MVRQYQQKVERGCRGMDFKMLIHHNAVLVGYSYSCLIRRHLRSCACDLHEDDEVFIGLFLLICVQSPVDEADLLHI